MAPRLAPICESLLAPRLVRGLVLGLFALSSCQPDLGEGSEPRRGHGGRGVLLVAVDALRADHLSSAGYDRQTTPALDSLIEEGVAFQQTFSTAPELIPVHVSLLTGCDPVIAQQPLPQDPGVVSLTRRWRIPARTPSLAVEFLAEGYATACFVDHEWLRAGLGFERGFERFDGFSNSAAPDPADLGAFQIGRRLLNWVRSLDEDRDWFAYVHLNDLERLMARPEEHGKTHFEPRPGLDAVPPVIQAHRAFFGIPLRLWPEGHQNVGEYEATYDGVLRQLDQKLGRLIALLDSNGRYENTTVCVVGTYGMGFGEAGLYLDHGTLADVDLHVPWILKWPAKSDLPRGVRANSLASLMDVAPTLLELAGIEFPEGLHGLSQLRSLREPGGTPVREFAYSRGGVSEGFAVHDDRYSYQSTIHATRGNRQLTASWYGTPRQDGRQRRRFLRDRESMPDPGDLGSSAPEPRRAGVLHNKGKQWYDWIEQARIALHDPAWITEAQSPELRAELVSRGLIPSGLPPASR